MGRDVFEKIRVFLDGRGVEYEHLTHGHVHSSHEAAKIRGNSVEQAAKAIILKVRKKEGAEFVQCILPGHKKIDLKRLKAILGVKNAGLASADEVLEVTGCTVGSVPPLGFLFGLKVYADTSLSEQKTIVFSAGTHNDSIKLESEDFIRAVKPDMKDFSE